MGHSGGASPKQWRSRAVAEWESRGTYRELSGHRVFTVEFPATEDEVDDPLLVIHGFPTSSFDFVHVVDALSRNRRVLLLDLVGYGLSDKPDIAYTLDLQADVVTAYLEETGVRTISLLTHDMGDTVGGELLARDAEGRLPVRVKRRVVTNGSVYIEMAHLSAGQQMLLGLPDARLAEGSGLDEPSLAAALAGTFSPHSKVPHGDLQAAAELVTHLDGHLLLPRTIRYIEERRRSQHRYTGAIETHASPLAIVWGVDDPIAVKEMATRLAEARHDASLELLKDVGHYLMLESPAAFTDSVLRGLGETPVS